MLIAVEGCAHGELDNIYDTIQRLEEKQNFKIDLLICCGDFQASRNEDDLRCMAVPPKYYNLCSFYKYYNGEKKAPVLTIFIGGNHEASNYLQELPYGGWVAPNIYYLGYAGIINIGGLRIGGISGIYKPKDFLKGHYEHCPYSDNTKRSVYHIRNLEVFRLKQISEPLDIFLSHDWPHGIWKYGNKEQLIRFKPYFEKDMESGELGSKPTEELLNLLKPNYWFAAHLHCKFSALVPHDCGKVTKFLALDKCLPKRRFLQVIDIPHKLEMKTEISYDLEWLTILRLTNHLLCVKNVINYLPGPNSTERWCFKPTNEEKSLTKDLIGHGLIVANNFQKTTEGYNGQNSSKNCKQPEAVSNSQTVVLCKQLSIDDPIELLLNLSANNISEGAINDSMGNQTFLDDSEVYLSSTTHKRTSLILPEPVGQNVLLEEEVDQCLSNASQLENDDEEKIEQEESKDDEIGSTSKTFKRRNAVLYQT